MANLAKPEKSAKIPKAADGLGDFFFGSPNCSVDSKLFAVCA